MNILQNEHQDAIVAGAIANSAIFFGAGYLYGLLSDTNRWKAAKLFMIYAIANTAIKLLVYLATGGEKEMPKTFYAVLIAGEGILGVLSILALRHFRLIAFYGTLVCAVGLYARSLYRLCEFGINVQKSP